MPASPPRPVAAVVLAGGLSRRMDGREKAFLTLAERPLLAHVLDRLRPQAAPLAINANGDPARFAAFGLPVIADHRDDAPGPLAGILAALDWATEAAPEVERVLTVPCDAPFLPLDLVDRLTGARAGGAVCASSGGRPHPVVGLWPVGLRETLRRAVDEEGLARVGEWARRCRPAVVDWPADPVDPFLNVNAPSDLAEAEAALSAGQKKGGTT